MNFKIKKFLGLIFACFVPGIVLLVLLLFIKNFFYSLIGFVVVACVLFILVNWVMLRHPFLQMIEGAGNILFTFDSTGKIQPFFIKIKPPFMEGKIDGKKKVSLFDRRLLLYLMPPLIANAFVSRKETELPDNQKRTEEFLTISLPKNNLTQTSFAFEGRPAFVYNTMKGVFLTKEMLADLEEKLVAHHLLLYLISKTEELTSLLRDFVRYIVEQMRPSEKFY